MQTMEESGNRRRKQHKKKHISKKESRKRANGGVHGGWRTKMFYFMHKTYIKILRTYKYGYMIWTSDYLYLTCLFYFEEAVKVIDVLVLLWATYYDLALKVIRSVEVILYYKTRMWAIAQRDGRPAEHRWCPLFNAANLADAHYYMPCSNAAKTRKPLKVAAGVPQTPETISAASGPKFTILWSRVEEILLLNKFFRLLIHALVAKI